MKNIKAMAQMGMQIEQYVKHLHPEFPIQSGKRSWEDYLPPLSTSLKDLVNKYGGNMQLQKRKTPDQPLKCWERER